MLKVGIMYNLLFWNMANRNSDMPPGTFSPEELDELPARVEKGLNESGGLWRVHFVWGKRA